MSQDEVLELFLREAESLGRSHIGSGNTIFLLAQLIADSNEQFSKECFDALVHIGGTMHQIKISHARARSEIAVTMQRSIDLEFSEKRK